MSKLIVENGEVVITIPNAFNIYQRLLILFTGNSGRYRVEKAGEFGHVSIFTENILKSLLTRAKLRIVDCSGGAAFFGGLIFLPKRKFGTLFSFNCIYRIKK